MNFYKEEIEYEPFKFIFLNLEGRCYCCGQKGHKLLQSCKRDQIPKEQWAIVKVKQSHELQIKESDQNSSSSKESSISSTNSKNVGWANLHIIMNKSTEIKTKILLDSGSSITLFYDDTYCKEIKDANDPIEVHTNGGALAIIKTCVIPDLG